MEYRIRKIEIKEKIVKDILYNGLWMAGITAVLAAGAYLAYKASEPPDITESADGYYEIYTAYDYERFWQKVTHNMPFSNGRLMEDIYLNDLENFGSWEDTAPVRKSREVPLFTGDFDGNGHTIYGLYSENGYGLTEKNEGTIHDFYIKSSLVVGEMDLGGICLYNEGTIRGCEFSGKLKSLTQEPEAYSWMAGISKENRGLIERCGYKGAMKELRYSNNRTKAGISVSNGGRIVNCYNFTWENIYKGSDYFYTIANRGEECCFTREDVRWDTYSHGELLPLDEMQALYYTAFLDKDLYTIYLGMENPPACFAQAVRMREDFKREELIENGFEEDKIKRIWSEFWPIDEKALYQNGKRKMSRELLKEIGLDGETDAVRKALMDEKTCGIIWNILESRGINWGNVILEGVSVEEEGEKKACAGESDGAEEDALLFQVRLYEKYRQEQYIELSAYGDGNKKDGNVKLYRTKVVTAPVEKR